MRTTTRAILALPVLLGLLACGGDDDDDASPSTTSRDDAPAMTSADATGAEPASSPAPAGTGVAQSAPAGSTAGTGTAGAPGGAAMAACDLLTGDEVAQITGATVSEAQPVELGGETSCSYITAELSDPIVTFGSAALDPGQFDTAADTVVAPLGGSRESLAVGDQGFITTGTLAEQPAAAAGFIIGDQFATVTMTQIDGDAASLRAFVQTMMETAAAKLG